MRGSNRINGREMDVIDIQSYEAGETSGYLDGVDVGFEMGYRSCVIQLMKEEKRKKAERIYFLKQKGVGFAMLVMTIICVILTGGDATGALLTLPIALLALFSKEKLLYDADLCGGGIGME